MQVSPGIKIAARIGSCLLLGAALVNCPGGSEGETEKFTPSPLMTVASAEPMVPLLQIAGKTPAEVEEALGPATGREQIMNKGRSYPKAVYRGGEVEVVFVDGRSDWITIFPKARLPFGEGVLGALGLPPSKPSFANPSAVIRWEDLASLREISIFPTKGNVVDYVYILVRTRP